MNGQQYYINLEPDSGGIWTAEIPALGIVTEGRGQAGARKAAERAIAGYVRGALQRGFPLPESDVIVTVTLPRASSGRGLVVAATRRAANFAYRKKSVAKKASGRRGVRKAGAKKKSGRKSSTPRR